VERKAHRLTVGDAIWLAPSVEREPRADAPRGRYLNVTFCSPWAELGAGQGQPVKLNAAALADAQRCADLAGRGHHEQAIAFHALCLRLLGDKAFARLNEPVLTDSQKTPGLWVIEELERIMAVNVGNPLRLDDMADIIGVSRATLGRMCQRHKGTSPAARFREIRLGQAREWLRQGKRSVTEIAHATGFSSSQHFATAFRNLYGRAPSSLVDEQISYMVGADSERERE